MTKMIQISVLVAGVVFAATTAQAQGAVDIGGTSALSVIGSVTTVDPDGGGGGPGDDESTAVIVGGVGSYTTTDGRFEYGAGVTIVGAFSDAGDIGIYSLSGQARVNTDLMGPEENFLLYGGAIVGLGIVRGDGIPDDEIGQFGPKAGLEFYLSPQTAVQVQEALIFDSEGGLTNQFTLGFKIILN